MKNKQIIIWIFAAVIFAAVVIANAIQSSSSSGYSRDRVAPQAPC